MKIAQKPFGTTGDGRAVVAYTMENDDGMTVTLLDYGATIQSLVVMGRDVVLGYDTIGEYEANEGYLGAAIGRVGNRIAKGQFVIDGTSYQVPVNDGPNSLHGGTTGFDKRTWTVSELEDGLCFTYVSPDGEEGYPGELTTKITYSLTNDNELILDYQATTTVTTPISLTNHAYFNLNGHDSGDVLDHELMLVAETYAENDPDTLPTGRLIEVGDTAFDFRRARRIGEGIGADDYQLAYFHGYDHNFVLGDKPPGEVEVTRFGELRVPDLKMEMFTDQPGVQFYAGNFLGPWGGKGGAVYRNHGGACFETQNWPDAVNRKEFPPALLYPGEVYTSRTIYKFS